MRVVVRPATETDGAAFARLHRELGVDELPPLVRQTLVADDGVVRGYVGFYRLGNAGHVRNLVAASDAIGVELMSAAADVLRAAGATEWHLSAKTNSPAAEQLGMRAEHRSVVVRLRWADVAKLPAELATVALATAESDDDLERAFGLPSGRVAMARRPGRVVLQLRDRELAVLGFGVFDPAFPGATPFHVARPALAAPLLASFRKAAVHDYVQIVVEDHDALADALVAAGATVRLRLLHYSGPLTTAVARCA